MNQETNFFAPIFTNWAICIAHQPFRALRKSSPNRLSDYWKGLGSSFVRQTIRPIVLPWSRLKIEKEWGTYEESQYPFFMIAIMSFSDTVISHIFEQYETLKMNTKSFNRNIFKPNFNGFGIMWARFLMSYGVYFQTIKYTKEQYPNNILTAHVGAAFLQSFLTSPIELVLNQFHLKNGKWNILSYFKNHKRSILSHLKSCKWTTIPIISWKMFSKTFMCRFIENSISTLGTEYSYNCYKNYRPITAVAPVIPLPSLRNVFSLKIDWNEIREMGKMEAKQDPNYLWRY
jgi:hypothetical protein